MRSVEPDAVQKVQGDGGRSPSFTAASQLPRRYDRPKRIGRDLRFESRSTTSLQLGLRLGLSCRFLHTTNSPEGRARARMLNSKEVVRARAEVLFVCVGAVVIPITGGH